MTTRRLIILIAIVAVIMTAGQCAWRHYRERSEARARLLVKQRLIQALGPASVPQGAGEGRVTPILR
jgi:hypothetical protein